MNESKDKTQRGPSSLQREAGGSESSQREGIKKELRKKIVAVREGHTNGGYCETEELHKAERQLSAVLETEIEELDKKSDTESQQRKHWLKREIAGFSWKPKLVVAENQD